MIAGLAGAGYLMYLYATHGSSILIKFTWLFIAICAIRSLKGLFELRVFWGKDKTAEGKVVEDKK